jgi:hypothetical protein
MRDGDAETNGTAHGELKLPKSLMSLQTTPLQRPLQEPPSWAVIAFGLDSDEEVQWRRWSPKAGDVVIIELKMARLLAWQGAELLIILALLPR